VPPRSLAFTAALCHAELAERRPAVQHLTAYFLLISAGGALGGLFNALLAPVLFPVPLEYPLLLLAAYLLRPAGVPAPAWAATLRDDSRWRLVLPIAVVALTLCLLWADGSESRVPAALLAGAVLLWCSGRRVLFALALAGFLLAPRMADLASARLVERSFFGVHRVHELPADNLVVLVNGTTLHGAQSTRPGEERLPSAYYSVDGPFGRFFAAFARQSVEGASVAVLGLGTGVLGCYARPGETWAFHEIDPAVERLARDRRWFRFMSECGNDPAVVLGDARLTLAASAGRYYDVIIVDVFSSDSVPVHLLTREALALYFARLKPGGTVLFHVSNRHLDLVPVVARLAVDAGAPARHLFVEFPETSMRRSSAKVVAITAPGGDLDALAADGWSVPQPGPVLWTDERSDVLGVIRWR
jgi:hypothetical protein